jgi:hypothetical protein
MPTHQAISFHVKTNMSLLLKSFKNVTKILPLTGWLNCKSHLQLPKYVLKTGRHNNAMTNVLASLGMANVASMTG